MVAAGEQASSAGRRLLFGLLALLASSSSASCPAVTKVRSAHAQPPSFGNPVHEDCVLRLCRENTNAAQQDGAHAVDWFTRYRSHARSATTSSSSGMSTALFPPSSRSTVLRSPPSGERASRLLQARRSTRARSGRAALPWHRGSRRSCVRGAPCLTAIRTSAVPRSADPPGGSWPEPTPVVPRVAHALTDSSLEHVCRAVLGL